MNTHEDFRNVIREERENLTRLCDYWNSQIKCEQTLSKDIQGRIRAAVGKTRLLMSEKFKQFEGLIEQSESNTAEKEITINDLQGFWDLILIQVNEVKEMFRYLCSVGEKMNLESRKYGKSVSPETDGSKPGYQSKKRVSSDHTAERSDQKQEVVEKEKRRSEAGDLKNKSSLSKL